MLQCQMVLWKILLFSQIWWVGSKCEDHASSISPSWDKRVRVKSPKPHHTLASLQAPALTARVRKEMDAPSFLRLVMLGQRGEDATSFCPFLHSLRTSGASFPTEFWRETGTYVSACVYCWAALRTKGERENTDSGREKRRLPGAACMPTLR